MTSRSARAFEVFVAATFIALLAGATTVAPASAKPKCQGKAATIVGTAKSEIIVGTSGPDVIVARGGNDFVRGRGGNDIICGGPGNDFLKGGPGVDRLAGNAGDDRLFGNGGPDRLFGEQGRDFLFGNRGNDRAVGGVGPDYLSGGVGDDVLAGGAGFDWFDGGPGTDRCQQNVGAGPKEFCELPTWMIEPEPPTLVIAYSDLDGDHDFGAGDVMISKVVDNDGNGKVSRSDSIIMGRYPTTLTPTTLADFGDWGVRIRTISYLETPGECATYVHAVDTSGGWHQWGAGCGTGDATYYIESSGPKFSQIGDFAGAATDDELFVDPASPSRPADSIEDWAPGTGDDRLIDVEFYY